MDLGLKKKKKNLKGTLIYAKWLLEKGVGQVNQPIISSVNVLYIICLIPVFSSFFYSWFLNMLSA